MSNVRSHFYLLFLIFRSVYPLFSVWQEVPYNTAQRNLGWTNLDDGSLRIDHYILCRNVRHKVSSEPRDHCFIVVCVFGESVFFLFVSFWYQIKLPLISNIFRFKINEISERWSDRMRKQSHGSRCELRTESANCSVCLFVCLFFHSLSTLFICVLTTTTKKVEKFICI